MDSHSPYPWRIVPVRRDGFAATPDFKFYCRHGVFTQVDIISSDNGRVCRIGPAGGDWQDADLVARVLADATIIQQGQAMAETMGRLAPAMDRIMDYLRGACCRCGGGPQCADCPMGDAQALINWAKQKSAEHTAKIEKPVLAKG